MNTTEPTRHTATADDVAALIDRTSALTRTATVHPSYIDRAQSMLDWARLYAQQQRIGLAYEYAGYAAGYLM